jgi:NAD(P)-dependent dehydrogenase (short-subunit alcohol dehydrogenase family)
MATATTSVPAQRKPQLAGQTVVVIGGSAGIGLETAKLARSEGADVILTGRDPERLGQAARDVGARSSASFDADDPADVTRFFDELPAPIDHVFIAAYTRRPTYGPMLEIPSEEVGQAVGRRVTQVLEIARNAAPKMRPGGVILLTGGSVKRVARESGISPAADPADLEARREELRVTLPIRRVVGPADLAALAVHLMTNTAITGAAYDIDGGQRLIA